MLNFTQTPTVHVIKRSCILFILFERKPALPFIERVTDITRKAIDKLCVRQQHQRYGHG